MSTSSLHLHRVSPPPLHPIRQLAVPRPVLKRLTNGIPLYVLDFPAQEVVKIELVFRVGRLEERQKLLARATSRLMREGTLQHSGAELAELIDFYGGSVSTPTNLDTTNFSLFCLKKYAAELVPLLAEILSAPTFPEKELATFSETAIAELSVELEKGDVLAYRKVTELIFGAHHPYGYNSVPADYEALRREALAGHHAEWLRPEHCFVVASGGIDASVLALIDEHLGTIQASQPATEHALSVAPVPAPGPTKKTQRVHVDLPGSLQTAISIGRRTFTRKHPDYIGLFILNTILGGYFGSRLMTNIREKKGFTYHIYSTLDAMMHDGCLYIATEVNREKTAATLRAIFAEMKKLRDNPVEDTELDMVRNYLLGMFLNGLDGPMNISDVVRGQLTDDMDWAFFDQLAHTIRNITAAEIQELAQRYLKQEDFWIVTVGES